MNIARLFTERVAKTPDKPAIIAGLGRRRKVVTYRELDRQATLAAGRLAASGLQPGDRVLLLQPMSIELYIAIHSIFKSGMVLMLVDLSAGKEGLRQCLQRERPDAFIGSNKTLALALRIPELRRIAIKFTTARWFFNARPLLGGARRQTELLEECAPRDDSDPAIITLTSGSTGTPKSAIRTHGFLATQHKVLHDTFPRSSDDIELVTLPTFLLPNLIEGQTNLIPAVDISKPASVDVRRLRAQLQAEHVTRLTTSPVILERIAEHCLQTQTRLTGLRQINTGGGPVFPQLMKQLTLVAPQARIAAVFGSTEAEPIALVYASDITATDFERMQQGAGLLAGAPLPAIEVAIDGSDPDGIGEIKVRGSHVLTGPNSRSNWHKTGDAGYLDKLGRLWLVGRHRAKIADCKSTIYPFQVEVAARTIPQVRRAALAYWRGQRLLVLEWRSTPTEEARAACRELEQRFQLNGMVSTARIPVDRRHNSKINYPELEALLARIAHPAQPAAVARQYETASRQ